MLVLPTAVDRQPRCLTATHTRCALPCVTAAIPPCTPSPHASHAHPTRFVQACSRSTSSMASPPRFTMENGTSGAVHHHRPPLQHRQPPVEGGRWTCTTSRRLSTLTAPCPLFEPVRTVYWLLRSVARWSTTGTWYVGVYCEHRAGINYTLAVNRFACPMECSGHGQCSQHQCTCEEVRVVPHSNLTAV